MVDVMKRVNFIAFEKKLNEKKRKTKKINSYLVFITLTFLIALINFFFFFLSFSWNYILVILGNKKYVVEDFYSFLF